MAPPALIAGPMEGAWAIMPVEAAAAEAIMVSRLVGEPCGAIFGGVREAESGVRPARQSRCCRVAARGRCWLLLANRRFARSKHCCASKSLPPILRSRSAESVRENLRRCRRDVVRATTTSRRAAASGSRCRDRAAHVQGAARRSEGAGRGDQKPGARAGAEGGQVGAGVGARREGQPVGDRADVRRAVARDRRRRPTAPTWRRRSSGRRGGRRCRRRSS